MNTLTFTAVVAGLIALVAIVLYNRLVGSRQRVREAWSAIDVQLQRRTSLIPNLVETVRGYASWERDTMMRVVEARGALHAASGPQAAAAANAQLTGALRMLFAVAEAYPELRANARFAQLQADLTDTENQVAFARNYYNGAVEAYNIRAQTVPGVLVARLFGFHPAEFFATNEAARAVPEARPSGA